MSAKIDVDHVTLAYEDKNDFFEAVQDVSFQVEKGEFISILGPSGCGKSTIISSILVLIKPTSGTIKIDGNEVNCPGIDRGIVFQSNSLFPWMTARRNVAFGVRQVNRKMSKKDREIRSHGRGFKNFFDN